MPRMERLSEFAFTQSRLSDDYLLKAREAYARYQQELEDLARESRDRARRLAEEQMARLRAASGGDDGAEGATAAWLEGRRSYAKIDEEYQQACQERYEKFLETIRGLHSEVSAQQLDAYIGLLQETRDEVLASPQKSEGKSKKSGSSGAKD